MVFNVINHDMLTLSGTGYMYLTYMCLEAVCPLSLAVGEPLAGASLKVRRVKHSVLTC